MPTPHDTWGEPIPKRRDTFSLASLLRIVTGICLLLGWGSVVRVSTHAAGPVLLAIAFVLSAVVVWRQPGGAGTKLAFLISYFTGVVFVGMYTASLSLALFPPAWMGDPSDGLLPLAGTCLGLLFLPMVSAIFVALLRVWLHLAADTAEQS